MTAVRGFDVTPVRARGLGGRKYARDFLRAVKKEGFGRLIEAVNGRSYIRWLGGSRYGFAQAPVGRHGEALIPRRSCAISHRNPFLHQHDKLHIQSETVKSQIRSEERIVIDSGPAVHRLQIDLYWGDDEPRGAAGRQPAWPARPWMEYAFETSVTVKRQTSGPEHSLSGSMDVWLCVSAQTQSRPGELPPSQSRNDCAPNRLNAALAQRSRSARFSDVTDLLVRPYDLPEPEVPRREFGFYRGLLKR